MTKAELVALITHQTGVEKTAAEAVVEAFMRNIKETMIAGEDVFLRGFGSFIVKERAEKVARFRSLERFRKSSYPRLWNKPRSSRNASNPFRYAVRPDAPENRETKARYDH